MLHTRFESSGFLLVGMPTNLVYAAPVENEEALHCTVDACHTIRHYPSIFEQMQQYMMRCVKAYIEYHGIQFEHI
jgi:hypothetical protein